ncbi:MAG TPA: hypothetical protein VIQ02_04130 [Jiangellaceae bacterium]
MAYTVGYGQVAMEGTRQPVRIRVAHIYRREEDEWKLVHRHGDHDERPTLRVATEED